MPPDEATDIDTRTAVLNAAAELVASGGTGALTTRAVAMKASIQPPTLYRIFGDKRGLLAALAQLAEDGPVLAGLSRKSMIGRLLGRPVEDRLIGSVTLALLAAQRGARILRVHDVAETVDALRLLQALNTVGEQQG